MHVADIARICHEANRALQLAQARDHDTGIPVSPHWDELSHAEQRPVVEGVGLALHGATAEQLHAEWCETKRDDGWTHGDVKDPVGRTHPCLVPYEVLSPEQQLKDALFRAIVNAAA